MDLWLVFLTGLTVGGITCMAVQGGLLASVVATHNREERSYFKIWAVLTFLISKLIAYSLLGFILGWIGRTMALSNTLIIVVQLLAGMYMIAVALNLLNIHPIFRYAIIQPPHFLSKFVRSESKSHNFFAPIFLGALTIFIPCGSTLAMEALAIASGSAILGAAIMAVFTFGTFPLFLGLGLITHLGTRYSIGFTKLAAIVIIYFGLSAINGSLVLSGSPVTYQTIIDEIPITIDLSGGRYALADTNVQIYNNQQFASIAVFSNGYNPNYLQLRSGIPANLTLTTNGSLGCTSQFRIPQLGIIQNLPLKGATTVNLASLPQGKYTWSCSMGMYTGTMEVI